jgi:hypothetical protein
MGVVADAREQASAELRQRATRRVGELAAAEAAAKAAGKAAEGAVDGPVEDFAATLVNALLMCGGGVWIMTWIVLTVFMFY